MVEMKVEGVGVDTAVTGRFKTSHLWSVENQPVSYPSWPCLFPA